MLALVLGLAAGSGSAEEFVFECDFEAGDFCGWSPGFMEVTSPGIPSGGTFAALNTCDGADTSPEIAWTAAFEVPGYAVTLTDLSNSTVHWVIWDIPGTAEGLPADVDKVFAPPDVPGARQTQSYNAAVRGYLGPCPPSGLGAHQYELRLYAVDVNPIEGLTSASTRAQVITQLEAHQVLTAPISASYTR